MNSTASNDTFNARHKSPVEVVRDFIPPPQFNELLGFNNCILVGPRGSGKTTLLKMLQSPALLEWNRSSNSLPFENIKFIGVFVAADVRWAKQLELVTKGIADRQLRAMVHEASFSNFVRLSLVESLEKAINLCIIKPVDAQGNQLDRKSEADLSRKLSEIWKIRPTPSFSSLKHELRVQQSDIPEIAAALVTGESWASVRQEFQGVAPDWLNAFTLAIETINDHLGVESQKWALLVDELEIIPSDLLDRILAPLRSTTANLVFKYALSPTGAGSQLLINHEEADPTQGNDFSTLRLWSTRKEDTRQFSSLLLLQALRARNLTSENSDLLGVLGSSGTPEELNDSEQDGSRISIEGRKKIFEELASKDESFREFLDNKLINISDLQTSDSSSTGTMVRKITPLVYLRNHVLKNWKHGAVSKRSKISSQPYQRFPNILDLTEGNPRWILNLAEYLGGAARAKNLNINAQGVQADAIKSFKDRFISMLRVYPVGKSAGASDMTPFDLLSKLGDSIREKVHYSAFSQDPALSFMIDKSAADDFGEIISICIHLGALVLIDTESSKESAFIPGSAGLEGRQVRICNRLAPEFFIPLRAGRSIKMSTALNHKGEKALANISMPAVEAKKLLNKSIPIIQNKDSQLDLF